MRLSALILLCGLAMLVRPAAAVDLRLTYVQQDASPYLAGTGQAVPTQPGITIELLQSVITQLGGTLRLVRLPGRRMIEEVKAGRQDGILGFRYSSERAHSLVYPMRSGELDTGRHLARLAHSLYRRRGDSVTWDGQRIAGLKNPIAVSSTQLISEGLQAQGVEIIRVEGGGQMFGMLALGRVDAVVAIDALGDRQMRAQSSGNIEKLMPPVLVEEFYLPVSPAFYEAHRDFVERLWTALGEQRDEAYARLLPKYLF